MVKDKYIQQVKRIIGPYSHNKSFKAFIFGSSLTRAKFGDLDLGLIGDISDRDLISLKESFFESTLPYHVDVVNFNKVSEQFKKNVFNNGEILWIKS